MLPVVGVVGGEVTSSASMCAAASYTYTTPSKRSPSGVVTCTVLPSWQMLDSDEAGVGVKEVAAVAVGEAEAGGTAGDADDGDAVAAVPGNALAGVALAAGEELEMAAAAVGVALLLVAAALSFVLSVEVTPFAVAVCDAGDVSGLKPPLPHTDAGGVWAAAVVAVGAACEVDDAVGVGLLDMDVAAPPLLPLLAIVMEVAR